jgi:hypothetical protein
LEGAIVALLRAFACDFRRLRFSRSASFNRSRLESFAGDGSRSSRSSLSSVIVNLFERLKIMPREE